MLKGYVPTTTDELTDTVRVRLVTLCPLVAIVRGVVGLVVTPLGSPDAVMVTLPLKPPEARIVSFTATELPRACDRVVGLAAMVSPAALLFDWQEGK